MVLREVYNCSKYLNFYVADESRVAMKPFFMHEFLCLDLNVEVTRVYRISGAFYERIFMSASQHNKLTIKRVNDGVPQKTTYTTI